MVNQVVYWSLAYTVTTSSLKIAMHYHSQQVWSFSLSVTDMHNAAGTT